MRKLTFIVFILCSMCIFGQSQNDTVKNDRDTLITLNDNVQYDKLVQAIINIESSGNEKAVSRDGLCVGILQIKKIVVQDCNEYLRMKGINKKYTYQDRFNKKKSIEMFHLIQERYKNYKKYRSKNSLEHAIRLWNGGCNYSRTKTNNYFKKVIDEYNKL